MYVDSYVITFKRYHILSRKLTLKSRLGIQKLILKQVWKQKIIWDGWIKACKETVPQSYAVMLQLPHAQLADFLDRAPLLRDPLLEHVQGFNESQRAHVSANTMAVLYNVKPDVEPQAAEDMDADVVPPGE